MEFILKILKFIGTYLITSLVIIGLFLLPAVLFENRKTLYNYIKENIFQKNYLKLLLSLLLLIFVLSGALNLALFKVGLAQDRFWRIKEYAIVLYFLFGTAELLIKRKKIIYDIKEFRKTIGGGGILWLGLGYLVGAVIFGSYIFGN